MNDKDKTESPTHGRGFSVHQEGIESVRHLVKYTHIVESAEELTDSWSKRSEATMRPEGRTSGGQVSDITF